MRAGLPKLLPRQRKFLGEVGVVVIGVLIALGAEQLIGQIHTNNEVAEARAAIRAEIGSAAADVRARLALSACVTRRANELDARLQQHRKGNAFLPFAMIGRPMSTPPISQAWETLKASPAAMHLPTEERLAYGALYATFTIIREVQSSERETWFQLQDFEGAPNLDPTSAMRLQGLIARAKVANAAMDRIGVAAMERVAGMCVRIRSRPPVESGSLCRPLP
jgi:type II secretory pathway pseudopilin PulG